MTADRRVEKLVGRCLMVGAPGPVLTDDFARLLDLHQIGNVILFGRSTPDPESTRRLTSSLRALRGPMLIAADQEGGRVQRLVNGVTRLPSAMALGAAGPEHVEAVCRVAGAELLAVGINMNLAPVLDVNSNLDNPVIGTRAFGSEREPVKACGRAAVRGYRRAGVVSCGKHFPGHGSTVLDSHLALPTIEEPELEPFAAAIEEGVDAIMVGHLAIPSLDPEGVPASLSRKISTEVLRESLGFQGVVCTDCLEMEGAGGGDYGELAIRAFLAGSDLILLSHTTARYTAVAEAMAAAVESGRISLRRLEASAGRVAALQGRGGEGRIDPDHRGVVDAAARAAVQVLRGRDRLPLDASRTHVVSLGSRPLSNVEDGRDRDPLLRAARARGCADSAAAAEHLVVGTRRASVDDDQLAAARALRPEVVLALDLPQDADAIADAPVAIAAYGDSDPLLAAAFDLLFGPAA